MMAAQSASVAVTNIKSHVELSVDCTTRELSLCVGDASADLAAPLSAKMLRTPSSCVAKYFNWRCVRQTDFPG